MNIMQGSLLKKIFYSLNATAMVWLLLIAFRLLLDFSYVYFVSPVFSYSGYFFDFSWVKYIESWLCMLFFISITPKKLNLVSDYLVFTMLYGLLIPVFSYYSLSSQSRFHLYIIMSCCALVFLFRKGKRIAIPSIRDGRIAASAIVIFMSALTTLWFIYTGGLGNFNLDFSKVYDYRSQVSEASYVGVMAYLIPWTTKVVGPALMGMALYNRNYIVALVVLFMHVLWFGFSSHKSVVFYPFLVIGLWAWFRNYRSFSPIILMAVFAIIASLVFWLYSGDILYASMFVRRVFFGVAKNTFDYFIFFTGKPNVYWSNSLTSMLLDYPYHASPAKLIGYWRDTEASVNNSFISTGYMHAGGLGVFIYGVFAGVLFRVIDGLSKTYTQVLLVLSAVLISSRALILSADLLTAMLTHGVGFAILLSILMKGNLNRS